MNQLSFQILPYFLCLSDLSSADYQFFKWLDFNFVGVKRFPL